MKICKKGLWDDTIPGVSYDNKGISNYAKIQLSLMNDYPQGSVGKKEWKEIVKKIKYIKNKKSKYDCIIGVAVTDSCYLMMLAKNINLTPAVNPQWLEFKDCCIKY